MKRIHLSALVACLIPTLGFAAGPQPFPGAQPQQPQSQVQQTGYHPGQHREQVQNYVADAYEEKHLDSVTYSGVKTQGVGGYNCQNGYCPPAGGGYQPSAANYYGGGYGATYATGLECGNGADCYPNHYYSAAYKRPRHVVYPQPNSTGGAVVYPYYTHKGPSDFFRK